MITKENVESYFHMWDEKFRRLTRNFENDIPSFSSHIEAQTWFEDIFEDKFMLSDSLYVENETLYKYTLVIDKIAWEKGQEELIKKGYTSGDFLMSSHTIEIFESGRVHIVY
ncbi:hypothetical protein ACFVS2_20155 [Brevibacillus sp. NPDC058079]|uniref:hypothetical protein n=1 Tax=Brevibacillus sp. NPDC058079 TaxID=3346330 RepID=UPI0036E81BDD